MNEPSMSIARPWWHPVGILPGLMTLFIAFGCCQAQAQVGVAGAKAPAASRVSASADHLGVAKSAGSLAVTIRVASLPQQITLCRKPGQARNDLTDGREYQWFVFINTDGNDATGTSAYVGGQGWEAKLSIYATDPADDLYLNHGCVPHAVDTTTALKARLLSVVGNGIDGSANTLTTLPVVLDFANNTLSVVLDRSLPALAGLSSAAKFDFVSLDIYYDNVIDQVSQFRPGSVLPVSVADASNDVQAFCVPTPQDTDTRWCQVRDIVGVSLAEQANAPSGLWTPTGNLITARAGHTATLLRDGEVLVAGGIGPGSSGLASTELYDPATGNWRVGAPLNRPRGQHTATQLTDGRVLVAGGTDNTTEIYDPATGAWTVTGNLNVRRSFFPAAVLLKNGKVLIAGGLASDLGDTTTSAEVYDPATGTWTVTGSMHVPRYRHTLTRLQDGRVLVVGGTYDDFFGYRTDSAELYDPETGTWTMIAPLPKGFDGHTATLLPSGKVLISGGDGKLLADHFVSGKSLDSAYLFEPSSGTWSATGILNTARDAHTATLLSSGEVLLAGGGRWVGNSPNLSRPDITAAELYGESRATWNTTAPLSVARDYPTATLLFNGKVLVVGGRQWNTPLSSAELFTPLPGATLWLNIRAAALTQQITQCREPNHFPSLDEWSIAIDADGNETTGDLDYAGAEALVFIQANDSQNPEGCALKAFVLDMRDREWGDTSRTFVPLVIDYAHDTLSVKLDRSLPELSALSPLAKFHFTSYGYDGSVFATDTVAPLTLGAALTAQAIDPGNDVQGCSPNPQWCQSLDIVGVSVSGEASVPPLVPIDGGMTGAWYDAAQSGHGIFIEVLPGNRLLAWWFSFNPEGTQQSWFGGVGSYSGDRGTIADVVQSTGGRWIPNFDKSQVVNHAWGSLVFTFTGTNNGRVEFDSVLGYGSGSMELTRLTQPAQSSATNTSIGFAGAVTTDASGNIYFSSSPDRVFKLDGGGKLTRIAGTGTAGYSGDGGPATLAQLNFPLSYPEIEQDPIDFFPLVGGLATDSSGNLYVADAYNNRVRRIDANGIISTVVGNGTQSNTGNGGPATSAGIHWPQGVALDASGNLYAASQWGELRRVAPSGVISTVVGTNCGPGFRGTGLCVPEQIAVDASGNVFVPDSYCRVRRVQAGGAVATVAGDDTHPSNGYAFTCGYAGDGGPATSAALALEPYGVAVDAGGNLFIADTNNNCVRKVNGAGVISTVAGVCTSPGFSGDNGLAASARLDHPRGVAVDAAGNLFIADTNNHRIRKVSTTGIITTIAGNGASGTIGPGYTGAWYDPNQSGHGLFIEVLPGNQLLAWWFAFNPAGTQQAWFGGVGTYNGNTATISAAVQTTGGSWIPNFDESHVVNQPWGTLTFTFSDCTHGRVNFNSTLGYGTGSMTLTRLTTPAGLACP